MEKIFKKALVIIKKAANIYHNQNFKDMAENHKYKNDIVTDKDIETQNFLVKEFAKLIPESGFIGEEQLNKTNNNEFIWIIDPIDGTFNYTQGIDYYGTQVALQKNKRTIFACLYVPCIKQMFWSYSGKSYCNGKIIKTSKADKARSVVLNISLPQKMESPISSETLMSYIRNKKLRIFGSSLYDFALVASGRADCLLTNSSTAWDVEPGLLVAVNAGAKVLHLKEHKLMIVAGNNKILNDIEKSLRLIEMK